MKKGLAFIAVIFAILVGINWISLELQTLAPSSGLPSPSSLTARAATAETSKPIVLAKAARTSPKAGSGTKTLTASNTPISDVPFLSQFMDIPFPEWQQVGCGITSLAMVINFYSPNAVSVDDLLVQGVAMGAYDRNAGWTFDGLIRLAEPYGLRGISYSLKGLDAKTAVQTLRKFLKNGPLMLSVHNHFNPKSAVPHLVVINGIKNNFAYYNDPAAESGQKKISLTNLAKGLERGFIVFEPMAKAIGMK